MAKPIAKKPARTAGARPAGPARPTLSFSRVNAVWLGAGAVSIAAGFAFLGGGSTLVAPVLLVLGYLVLLPIGIIKK